MTLQISQIESTIHDISDFFTDWVGGRCPGDVDTFRRNALDRLADNLVAIMPGTVLRKKGLRGLHEKPLRFKPGISDQDP